MAREPSNFFVDNLDGTRVESNLLPTGWIEVDQQSGQIFFRHLHMPGNPGRELLHTQDGTGIFNPFNVAPEGGGSGMHFVESIYLYGIAPGVGVSNMKAWVTERCDELQLAVDDLVAIWDARTEPTAVILPPGSAAAGVAVTFDGSSSSVGTAAAGALPSGASHLGDTGDLFYAWDFSGAAVPESGSTLASVSPVVKFSAPGTFEVTLTVRDSFGRTYPDFPSARTSVMYTAS